MKQFAVYTLLRLGLVAVVFGVLWLPLHSRLNVFELLLLAMLISAIIALFALRGARDRFAVRVAERADKIQAARREPPEPDDPEAPVTREKNARAGSEPPAAGGS